MASSLFRADLHPHQLGALIELARRYKLLGRFDENIRYCDEAMEGLQETNVTQHLLERKLREQTILMGEWESTVASNK